MFNLSKLYNKLILKRTVKKKMKDIELALPEEFRAGFRENFYLAGGAIRNMLIGKKVKDWDIFCKSKGFSTSFLKDLGNRYGHPGMIIQFKSDNALSLYINGSQVQFIGEKYAGKPDDVVSKFDFTNSMCYYDIRNDKLILKDEMVKACENRELVFNDKAFSPKLSPKRAQKFIREDWEYSDSFNWYNFETLTGHDMVSVKNTNFRSNKNVKEDTTEDYE